MRNRVWRPPPLDMEGSPPSPEAWSVPLAQMCQGSSVRTHLHCLPALVSSWIWRWAARPGEGAGPLVWPQRPHACWTALLHLPLTVAGPTGWQLLPYHWVWNTVPLLMVLLHPHLLNSPQIPWFNVTSGSCQDLSDTYNNLLANICI